LLNRVNWCHKETLKHGTRGITSETFSSVVTCCSHLSSHF
jgi:hypothetical protein